MPSISKILKNIIKSRLLNILQDHNFPYLQQQGFQKNLSCLRASLFNLQESVLHIIEMGSKMYAAFLDSKKAFDTV